MKTGEVILLGGAGLVAYTILTKGTALSRLILQPGSVKDFRLQGLNVHCTVEIIAQNTSNQNMTLRSLAATVYVFNAGVNQQVGNLSAFGAMQPIPPNSQVVLQVDTKLDSLNIVSQLVNAYNNNSAQFQVKIEGYANVDNYQIPVDLLFNVP